MSEAVFFDGGAKVRWQFGRLREMLGLVATVDAPDRRDDSLLSIEVFSPKGPYSVYGGIEVTRLEAGQIASLRLPEVQAVGEANLISGNASESYFGLPSDVARYLQDKMSDLSRPFPVMITDAVHDLVGSSIVLFDILLGIAIAVSDAGSTDPKVVEPILSDHLRRSGVIRKNAKRISS